MKKKTTFSKIVLSIIIVLLVIVPVRVVIADSGFDYDYDSGSSSDYDSGNSYSSSDYSSNRYSSESSSMSDEELLFFLVLFIIVFVIATLKKVKNSKNLSKPIVKKKNMITDEDIKKIDPELDTEAIVSKTFDLYKKLQNAWSTFDEATMRTLLSDELYNTYRMQLSTLKVSGQRNVMENIIKRNGYVESLKKEGNILTAGVVLSVTMRDYIINKYGATVRGNRDTTEVTYYITIDKVSDNVKRVTNCPNCGGALGDEASQRCKFCGSNLVLASKDFIISKKENIGQNYSYSFNNIKMNVETVKFNINDFDKSIDNSMFMTKVDNLFVQLYTGFSKGDLKDVRHKITDNVYLKYQNQIDYYNSNNYRRVFEEFNVTSTEIIGIERTNDSIIVKVKIISKYMDYIVNKDTNFFVTGTNQARVQHENILTLKKKNNAKEITTSLYCPGCGKPANVNETGHCAYCGATFNTEDYDYVLTDIEVK